MSDYRRVFAANALAVHQRNDLSPRDAPLCRCGEPFSMEHQADAVLAVLPSEGYEQVGWYSQGAWLHTDEAHGWHYPTAVDFDCVPVYRRVDGAAPPEPECGCYTICERPDDCVHAPASSTPTEVERTEPRCTLSHCEYCDAAAAREALVKVRKQAEPRDWETPGHPMNDWTKREPILRIVDAALSGQQDTTEAHDG